MRGGEGQINRPASHCPHPLLPPPSEGEGSVTFLLVQKSDAKRHAREGDCDFPRLTNLKTHVCVLINFAYELVKYFNFLGSDAVRIFYSFVYDNLFNQRVEHFGSQLCGLGVLLD